MALATEAARIRIEALRDQPFDEVFTRFNDTAADDPAGAQGSHFQVERLTLRTDDGDGFAGRVLFPTPAGSPGVLRENLPDPRFGTPRDLNGDGNVDALDHALDYRVLPVVVRVDWRGAGGNSFVELKTLLVEMP